MRQNLSSCVCLALALFASLNLFAAEGAFKPLVLGGIEYGDDSGKDFPLRIA